MLPHPPVRRALREAAALLRGAAAVDVSDWVPHQHDEAWAIVSSLYFPDGGEADADMLAQSGEPWLPLTEWIIKENECVKPLTRAELEYWQEEREEFRLEYAAAWNATGVPDPDDDNDDEDAAWDRCVDAILCPASATVATRPGTAKYWSYTAVWNLLDYPALAFPFTTADKRVDLKDPRSEFMSGLDKDTWELCESESSPRPPCHACARLAR